jgi:hypothetical protein
MLTNKRAEELRERIPRLTRELEQLSEELKHIEATCQHSYGDPVYNPIEHKGYHIAGDPPGVGGADHRFPMDVPAKTEDRWTRVCSCCGKTEHTSQTQPTGRKPVF